MRGIMYRIITVAVIAFCAFPSAVINAEAWVGAGYSYGVVTGIVFIVYATPFLTIKTALSYSDGYKVAAIWWGLLSIFFICVNMIVALQGISSVRELVNDRNAELMRSAARRTKASEYQDERISYLRKTIGNASSHEFQAMVDRITSDTIYSRSAHCTSVTMADSQKLCQELAAVNSKLLIAKEVELLEKQRASRVWNASTSTEITPTVRDAQIENISALIAPILGITPNHRFLMAALSAAIALAFELLADIVPIAVIHIFKSDGVKDSPLTTNESPVGDARSGERHPVNDPVNVSIIKPVIPCQMAETNPVTHERSDDIVVRFPIHTVSTISAMRDRGMTWKQITTKLGVSESTARRRLKDEQRQGLHHHLHASG